MHESDARLVILFTLLVAELADMAACLARLAAVPRLDDLRARTKRAESALAWHERRVLLVSEQPAHDRAARVGVLRRLPAAGLRVVAPHAAMADAVTRGQHQLEVRVAERDLVFFFWQAIRVGVVVVVVIRAF